ncbi:MAG: ABC transporter substrate-binding protein [Candidatus Thorarchaeota archaeon]
MANKCKFLLLCFTTLGMLTVQLLATTTTGAAYERPESYFELEIMVPTNKPTRILVAQLVARELWKIGIDAEVQLMGWERFLQRRQAGEWEAFIAGWNQPDVTTYHSRNFHEDYPLIPLPTLDAALDRFANDPDFDKAHAALLSALRTIIWEFHPLTAFVQHVDISAWDAALRGSIPGRGRYHRLYFEDDKQSTLTIATASRFINLNPAFQTGIQYEVDFQYPAFSRLYEYNADGILEPILAAADPIPIGSNEAISDRIDPATIADDSPYKAKTTWGPNPNIDAAQYNNMVAPANYSMLLVRIREGIPWHPGYGYTEAMRLNVTADDLLWTSSYVLNEELSLQLGSNAASYWANTWGSDCTKGIEKINDTLVKFNVRGPSGNGIDPDWRDRLDLELSPKHVLDPAFNATPFGGGIGVTPDGTKIRPYAEHQYYRYNTGEGSRPLPATGPYILEQWHESQQVATYTKFNNWGGYGANSLWQDPRFQDNNIETINLQVISTSSPAILDLENGKIDILPNEYIQASDVSYLARQPTIQLKIQSIPAFTGMVYDQWTKLDDRYVRLAISHLVPRQSIAKYLLGGFADVNEVLWLPISDDHYPKPDEWQTIGLPQSENVIDLETGEELKFQGHIRYSVRKAQALMEKAGYDMTAFREAVKREEAGEQAERSLEPLPFLLASAGTVTLVGAALILGRRYWQQYLATEPETLQLSKQRKRVMKAIKLKQSSRMGEKAQAQELFQQMANDETLAPELTIYSMLNLCDMLLDEVRTYGETSVFHEAELLSNRIQTMAQQQDSSALQVEALLLQSKFALLEGKITRADKLLEQAATAATTHNLPKLAKKVTQEQAMLAKEVNRWETLTTEATPIQERLEHARLQDYIASAVRVIELEGGFS